jgi:uncharacterized membrane protein
VRSLLTFSAILESLAITIWVGGMAALSFIAAPAIFQTAPSRESAGRSFGLILRRFHWVAYGCGVIILIAGVMRWSGSYRMVGSEVVRYVIALVMLGLALYSGLIISRQLERVRARMAGGVDRVPKGDPRREEFNQLHRRSTTVMAFNLLLGLALAVMFAAESV